MKIYCLRGGGRLAKYQGRRLEEKASDKLKLSGPGRLNNKQDHKLKMSWESRLVGKY